MGYIFEVRISDKVCIGFRARDLSAESSVLSTGGQKIKAHYAYTCTTYCILVPRGPRRARTGARVNGAGRPGAGAGTVCSRSHSQTCCSLRTENIERPRAANYETALS